MTWKKAKTHNLLCTRKAGLSSNRSISQMNVLYTLRTVMLLLPLASSFVPALNAAQGTSLYSLVPPISIDQGESIRVRKR